ncbi:putative polysaccharide biosynthesis protein [Neobacillus cucumis]|uniref:putative polysaccharide biosynthesis protein n=1 Tax=Neobacillus cucumis TaxID=1740721 RepID=UPI0019632AF3|nr:polysaccharide biosynthesis protein [Neobacillus cucumis]MBM7655807.1 O-antigen/teichoic acid export membrane protein [Neobacillus cucumis]
MQKLINQPKAVLNGALILTISAIVTKILSAFYRIPFQNIVGDVGFYIYQQVYPFYGMAVVLSTTGFPVVISKLYAEQKERGDDVKPRLLLLASYLFLQVFGVICFFILYVGADGIADWMNDPHLAMLLRVVAFVFLAFPFSSLLRGYYQAVGEMLPTALSQVGEQSIRVLTIIILSSLFMAKGYSLYLVGSGAMFGSITGTIISAIILFMFLWIRKEWKIIMPSQGMFKQHIREVGLIWKALFFQGLMICISGMLMIFMQLVDSLNLYSLLTAGGMKADLAKTLKGVFDRGQPLIQLGTVAATSMSLTLVPLITRARIAAKPRELLDKIQLAIKVSIAVGVGASAGLWAIIEPTNTMLFENNSGSSVLGVLSFVILFTSIISTIIAIMQGMGKVLFPAIAVMLVLPIKYLLNMMMIPAFGIMGAAISSLISLAAVTLILAIKFKKMSEGPLLVPGFIKTILMATIGMILLLKGYLYITDDFFHYFAIGRLGAALQSISAVLCGGLLFLWVIIRGGVFLEEELALFPLGSKLIHLLARKDRS